jgi:hypothetical protein
MRRILVCLLILGSGAAAAPGQSASADPESFFELTIRPVLAGTCFKCHGEKKTSGGLRVDSRGALLKGGDSGPAVVPGDPSRSLLIAVLRHSAGDIKMPPGRKLAEAALADFETWIRQGAVWPVTVSKEPAAARKVHWAFQPVRKAPPPRDPSGWAMSPIDCFIAADLRKHELRPVGAADRRTLLRRLYFDLIGLPPRPEEVADFLADSSSLALAKVADRLLASPHYGERWGRYWMDVARYADTAGDNADYPIPEVHRYRDYIIDAFNGDKPYDQFIQEQVAGDILAARGPPEEYARRVSATGFLALSRRYATAPYELWHLTLEDAIDTTGQAFLGLTLRCARCHDHKFDPVTMADYYALYGIFASTRFPYAGSEEFASMKKYRQDFVPLLPPAQAEPLLKEYREKVRRLPDDIARLEKDSPLAKSVADLSRRCAEKTRALEALRRQDRRTEDGDAARQRLCDVLNLTAELGQLLKERDSVLRQLQEALTRLRLELGDLQRRGLPGTLPGAYAVSEGKPADVCIQKRGDPASPGVQVRRGAIGFLDGRSLHIPPDQSGRWQLAQWLTRPQNPLTARVMANRIWQHHFGRGIVGTPNNFGLRGEEPTHPELLDYLAALFMENGWSVKALHRLIVLSKTYQMAGDFDAANGARDEGNKWYWRFNRRRLDAEAIRDALLLVSGTLELRPPGAHPFPPITQWGWTQHNPFKEVYASRHRSVYLMTQRLQKHPFLALFDGPDTNMTTERRTSSTVPLQALFWMNSPMMRETSEAFSRRLLAAAPETAGRIRLAFELAYARPPRFDERERGRDYLQRYQNELRSMGVSASQAEVEALTSYARVVLSANEFVHID